MNNQLFKILTFVMVLGLPLFGQEISKQDSTVQIGETRKNQIEGPIQYEAQSIENLIEERKMILTGQARIKYLDMTLAAEKITVFWDENLMRAEGVWDTTWAVNKETGDSSRVVKLLNAPEFKEGRESSLTGEIMLFNFKTKKGRVLRGRTQFEDGKYVGNVLKMVKPRTLNVSDANYTTCDKEDEPHFHFWSQKMKIESGKKVVAKPIVMYIGNIPVLALPFAYFPIRKDRQSGIILPRYGISSREGRFLKGFGYYWAASQYWDLKGIVDYYEKSGFLFRTDLKYNVRYKMRGSISGSWTRKDFDVLGTKERRWDLTIRHSQEINQTTQLTVSGNFISSGNFYKELSANREMRMQNQIRSNAVLRKRWGGSGNFQIAMNQTRTLNSENDRVTELFPEITISNRFSNLIPKAQVPKGEEIQNHWYHQITIPYQFKVLARNERTKVEGSPDTKRQGAGVDHRLSMYVSPQFFGWLNVRPSLNLTSTWFDRRNEYYLDDSTNTIQSREKKGFFTRNIYNTSLSFDTKIYGLFQPKFLNQVLLRHVITPRVSFSYTPDFSDDQYGYYETIIDTLGNAYEKDLYSGSLFGSTTRGGGQSMNVAIDNVFQMKVGEGENEKKFDLFSWNITSGYNWKAEKNRIADIQSRIQTRLGSKLNMSIHSTYSLYPWDSTGIKRTHLFMDEINWSSFKSILTGPWIRLTNFKVSASIKLKGSAKTRDKDEPEPEEPSESEESDLDGLSNISGDRMDTEEGFSGLNIPWDLNASLSYYETKRTANPIKRFYIQTNLNFNITKNWKVSHRARFDFVENKFMSQDFSFIRDLHCWQASISWTPIGYNKRFYFRINVKSPKLSSIKYERGTGRTGIRGSFY